MNPDLFIRQNIERQLSAEGFSQITCQLAADVGVDYYRRMSQASRKGRAFDDCLVRARVFATGQDGAIQKKPAKRKPARQRGLFS
jgi:hypothetical protein